MPPPFARIRPLLLLAFLWVGCLPTVGEDDGPKLRLRPLPAAVLNVAYEAELSPAGGTPPFAWEVAGLPPGFSFFPAEGLLQGTPREPGSFTLDLRVTDAAGRSDARAYALEVLATAPVPEPAPEPETFGCRDEGPAILRIANWNLEWFGHPGFGPTNERQQLERAAEVISRDCAQLWALNEIVAAPHFAELLAALPGYTGLLANESRVHLGRTYYSTDEQKPALIWKEGLLEDVSASLILESALYDFAGRPPLKVEATVQLDGVRVPLTLVVLHLKAFDGEADWARRHGAALALKGWLDALPEGREVLVLGDWNDDLDVSIVSPLDTPFRALLEDPAYTFLTLALTEAKIATTVNYPTAIDHQLATAPLAARLLPGAVDVVRPGEWSPPISAYRRTTSDHYPVRTRFALDPSLLPRGGGTPGAERTGGTAD